MSLKFKLKQRKRKYQTGELSSVSIGDHRDSSGFGYITLPKDLEREAYIRTVFETGQAMIVTSQNQIIKKARIPLHLLNDLQFPEEGNDLGALVNWVNVPKSNEVVVTGILLKADQFYLYNKENILVDEKKSKSYTVTKTINLNNTAQYSLIVANRIGDDGGQVFKAYSAQEGTSAHVKILCEGVSEVYGDEEVVVKSEKLVRIQVGSADDEKSVLTIDKDGNFEYTDRNDNYIKIEKDKMTIESKEILHGDSANEPIILGDKLVDTLGNILDAIIAITVPTAMGPSGVPVNAAQFTAIKATLDTLKSTKNKVK